MAVLGSAIIVLLIFMVWARRANRWGRYRVVIGLGGGYGLRVFL